MIYFLNLLLIIYLILMVYYWGSIQGLLSAFLHLVLTVVAGALALALWEPLTVGFLLERMPGTAWCLGLLGPFILILIVLRVAVDKLVPGNMRFHPAVNVVAGGFCGLCSGILISGLGIIGLGFLPMDFSLLGYQPYKYNNKGQLEVNAGGQLWWPVDRQAGGFYSALSGGALYPGLLPGREEPHLALYRPRLADEPGEMRLTRFIDIHAKPTVDSKSVEVMSVHSRGLPVAGLPDDIVANLSQPLPEADHKLVIVDTRWADAAKDSDRTLRLPPNQIRLIIWRGQEGDQRAEVLQPVGATRLNDGQREFYGLSDSTTIYPTSQDANAQLGWVFIVPAGTSDDPVKLKFLMARNLRLELPAPVEDQDEKTFLTELGKYTPPSLGASSLADGTSSDTTTASRNGAGAQDGDIEVDNPMLPQRLSRNMAIGGLVLQDKDTGILSGERRIETSRESGWMDRDVVIDRIFFPSQWTAVRVRIDYQSHTAYGAALTWAKLLNDVALVDDKGERHYPTSWVVNHNKGAAQTIRVGSEPISRAAQLPIVRTMNRDDEIYLYFPIKPGTRIVTYALGEVATRSVDLLIPKAQPRR